jgi:hypothetical protein
MYIFACVLLYKLRKSMGEGEAAHVVESTGQSILWRRGEVPHKNESRLEEEMSNPFLQNELKVYKKKRQQKWDLMCVLLKICENIATGWMEYGEVLWKIINMAVEGNAKFHNYNLNNLEVEERVLNGSYVLDGIDMGPLIVEMIQSVPSFGMKFSTF